MVDNGRYRIDVLDRLSAVTAAIDAIAVPVLDDHVNAYVRHAIESGDTDDKVNELITAIRRFVQANEMRRHDDH